MKNLWLIMAMVLLAGCGDCIPKNSSTSLAVGTREDQPLKVQITNNPDEARIKAVEARVDQLENWVVKFGGRVR